MFSNYRDIEGAIDIIFLTTTTIIRMKMHGKHEVVYDFGVSKTASEL